jgi:hypothetical protein
MKNCTQGESHRPQQIRGLFFTHVHSDFQVSSTNILNEIGESP